MRLHRNGFPIPRKHRRAQEKNQSLKFMSTTYLNDQKKQNQFKKISFYHNKIMTV